MRSRVSLSPAIALGVLLVVGVRLWNLGVTLPDEMITEGQTLAIRTER